MNIVNSPKKGKDGRRWQKCKLCIAQNSTGATTAILGPKKVVDMWPPLFSATTPIFYIKIWWQQNNANSAVAVAVWTNSDENRSIISTGPIQRNRLVQKIKWWNKVTVMHEDLISKLSHIFRLVRGSYLASFLGIHSQYGTFGNLKRSMRIQIRWDYPYQ